MAHRFRFLATKRTDQQWILLDDEVRHAKVLRLKPGDPIEICDGQGAWAVGVWQSGAEKTGHIEVEHAEVAAPPSRVVTLCLGALKHQEIDDLIPQLSEVGVDKLFVFLHGQLEKSRIHERAVERWEKIALRSVKQCKRAWVMQVKTFHSLDAVCKALPSEGTRLLAVPGAATSLIELGPIKTAASLLVGSEAGLSPEEEAWLISQFQFTPVGLGSLVLRAVTCALVGGALLKLAQGRPSS